MHTDSGSVDLSKVKRCSFVGINTLVVDFKLPEGVEPIVIPGMHVEKGVLIKSGIVDLERYGLTEAHLKYADLGGQGNIVPVVKRILPDENVGVMGNHGDDFSSRFFSGKMLDLNIDISGLINVRHPIGRAIMTRGEGDREGIAYFYGANGSFDGTEHVRSILRQQKPIIVQCSYVGLSPNGWDKKSGENLREFLKYLWLNGAIRIVDPHTFGSEQDTLQRKVMEEYLLLPNILPETDIFICSRDETRRILNAWEIPYDNDDRMNPVRVFLEYMEGKYFNEMNDMPKLFGVSMREGVAYTYQDAWNRRRRGFVESDYHKIPGAKLVGAGDSLKASLAAYIIKHYDDFMNGEMDIEEAIQFAMLGATLYVAVDKLKFGLDRFELLRPYNPMMEVIKSRERFSDRDTLMARLDRR